MTQRQQQGRTKCFSSALRELEWDDKCSEGQFCYTKQCNLKQATHSPSNDHKDASNPSVPVDTVLPSPKTYEAL